MPEVQDPAPDFSNEDKPAMLAIQNAQDEEKNSDKKVNQNDIMSANPKTNEDLLREKQSLFDNYLNNMYEMEDKFKATFNFSFSDVSGGKTMRNLLDMKPEERQATIDQAASNVLGNEVREAKQKGNTDQASYSKTVDEFNQQNDKSSQQPQTPSIDNSSDNKTDLRNSPSN